MFLLLDIWASQDLITWQRGAARALIVNDNCVMVVATAQRAQNVPIVPTVWIIKQLTVLTSHCSLRQ